MLPQVATEPVLGDDSDPVSSDPDTKDTCEFDRRKADGRGDPLPQPTRANSRNAPGPDTGCVFGRGEPCDRDPFLWWSVLHR